ncbi:MAG: hypothetical protein II381_05145, partial [Victivallales bacterium]|nr:hypothetical protein [Victivallales bacterium]
MVIDVVRIIILNPDTEVGGCGTTGNQLGGRVSVVVVGVVVVQINGINTTIAIQITVINTIVNEAFASGIDTRVTFAQVRIKLTIFRVVIVNIDSIIHINICITALCVREHPRQEGGLAGLIGGPERNRDV